MSERLRAALVGCGRMGAWTLERVRGSAPPGWLPLSHAEAMEQVEGIELVGCADPAEEARERTAERYRIAERFADGHELIDELRPDLLAIATRTPGRCELIEHAVEAGVRGIHAEKPLGNSLGEVRAALRKVEQGGAALSYGATRRHMPAYRRAEQLLDEGRIGDLEQITVEFGRTLLMWNLPHATDLLVQFSQGRPARAVRAVAVAQSLPGDAPGGRLDADPVLRTGWVDLGGEVEGVISAARGMNLVLEGREARLIVAADGSRLRLERAAGGSGPYRQESEELPFEIGPSGTVRAFRSLRDAVLGQGGGGLPGLAELERAHEILFALAASALRGGEAVDPDEQEEGLVVTGLTSGLPA